MTGLQLLSYILGSFLLQLMVALGFVIWRMRQNPSSDLRDTIDLQTTPTTLAWKGLREFRVSRRTNEDLSKSQCSFDLIPVDGQALPDFLPGQFLTFSLPAEALSNAMGTVRSPVTRCYSLSDRPVANHYRVTIKRALPPSGQSEFPPGIVSSYFLDRVRIGDVLKVKAPSGKFYLDTNPAIPAVFLAGGVGVTPMLSMLLWSVAKHPTRELHLFYGVGNSEDHAFKSVLEALAGTNSNFHLTVLYANPGKRDQKGRDFHESGFINLALLKRSLPDNQRQFYVCGPPAMMASVIPALQEWGVKAADIRSESFGPAATPVKASQVSTQDSQTFLQHEIRFARSGRTITWCGDDTNLLDFAERNNIAVESGCRNGSCGSCETKLITGKVRNSSMPEYTVKPHHCLLCIASPDSSLVLEA